MNLRAGDIAIDRLTVKASARAEAGTVAGELRRASWPSDCDGRWVIVRAIRLRSPRPWLARQAAIDARRLVSAAVHGSDPRADAADAVCFDNLPQLLAWLLKDIANDCAQRRWYWRGWASYLRGTVPENMARLLIDQVLHLPAVVLELERIRALPAVWYRLAPDRTDAVLQALGRVTGTDLRGNRRTATPERTSQPAPPWLADIATSRWWPVIDRRWQAIIAGLAADDARHRLALALVALQAFPLQLQRDGALCLQAIAHHFKARTIRYTNDEWRQPADSANGRAARSGKAIAAAIADGGVTIAQHADGQAQNRARPPLQSRADGDPAAAAAPEALDAVPAGFRQAGYRAQRPLPDGAGVASQRPFSSVAAVDRTHNAPVSSRQTSALPEPGINVHAGGCHSEYGGLFYLINALQHPRMRALIDSADAWTRLPSGWAWLFRLGQTLALPDDDPASAFLAGQMGSDDVVELQSLPPLPLRETVVSACENLYGTELWNPGLLRVAADIADSGSHLDIALPMSAVRLPLRLAGLDINPGWVPWLGRVVTFHYRGAKA